jgi:hypothetical protein
MCSPRAAIARPVDYLRGLKENVIVGRLIPAAPLATALSERWLSEQGLVSLLGRWTQLPRTLPEPPDTGPYLRWCEREAGSVDLAGRATR